MENTLLPSKETFYKVVDKIIDSSKYMHLKEKENILQKILEKLGKFLDRIFETGQGPPRITTYTTQNLFFVFVIIGIIALLYYLLGTKKITVGKKKVIYGETIDENTTYESLYQRALESEKKENYKDAIRLQFISAILYMNEKSLCFLDDTKTNNEIFKILKHKEFKGAYMFKSIGDYFQYIWYGKKEVHLEKFSWYKEKINNLFVEVKNYNEKE